MYVYSPSEGALYLEQADYSMEQKSCVQISNMMIWVKNRL
jgi:hypothetical protein